MILKRIIRKIFKIVYSFLLFFFKIKNNKIVFDNFSGRGYGCNPKYIANEIINQDLKYDMVWLVKDLSEEMPCEIRKVKYGSFKALYELATAKIWVDNVRDYKGIKKKKNQYYIQTWHGSLNLKKCEKEVLENLSKNYVEAAKNDGKITNLIMSNNKFMTKFFKEDFWYTGNVIEVGLPRNDILYSIPNEITEKVYKYFKIDKNKKIVIYAPTFRKNLDLNLYKFNFEKCCKVLEQKFNNQYVMLLRLHPNISQYKDQFEYNEIIKNATMYPDMQELLATADVAITDYSSISVDMSIVGKKVFLLCKDLLDYKKNERALNFEIEELPFDLSETEDELFNCIEKFSYDEYLKKCNKFYNKIGIIKNENASKNIVEIIKQQINNKGND